MLTKTIAGNPCDAALENFDTVADAIGLENDVREMIKYPELILMVLVPVRLDDGHIRIPRATAQNNAGHSSSERSQRRL
jgi:glutamate dehydrogenase/leucine dehydrogenase